MRDKQRNQRLPLGTVHHNLLVHILATCVVGNDKHSYYTTATHLNNSRGTRHCLDKSAIWPFRRFAPLLFCQTWLYSMYVYKHKRLYGGN